MVFYFFICPPGRARTYDRLLKRELLYQLSYGRKKSKNKIRYAKSLRILFLCRREDLNLHGSPRLLLRQVRLPISPPRHEYLVFRTLCVLLISQSVPRAGIEPARPCEHKILSLGCLPIPPPRQK